MLWVKGKIKCGQTKKTRQAIVWSRWKQKLGEKSFQCCRKWLITHAHIFRLSNQVMVTVNAILWLWLFYIFSGIISRMSDGYYEHNSCCSVSPFSLAKFLVCLLCCSFYPQSFSTKLSSHVGMIFTEHTSIVPNENYATQDHVKHNQSTCISTNDLSCRSPHS